MRVLLLVVTLALPAAAQEVGVAVRPEAIYIENAGGDIRPVERAFFHIVIENKSAEPVDILWVRFDIVNSAGIVISGQYSGQALIALFDSAIDRKRIEPTAKKTLTVKPTERKALSDIFIDLPEGFIGEQLLVEVEYKANGKETQSKTNTPLSRMSGFSGRLPFDGIWYVSAEHSYLDPHKRFLAEAFAYDFVQIGANGKSFQRDGKSNADYYAYGKKVLAAKDGTVLAVRSDVMENTPGETVNSAVPGGNVVIIDHGNGQYGYYAHLKPSTVTVKVGARVKAGDPIGEVGNSGDSTEPHLHFHVMNKPDPADADGIPVGFENWKSQSYSHLPSTRELGILPRGEFVQP
jgi:murein DD-endopeptidase MepM/ murein hydrolase activator NlpD